MKIQLDKCYIFIWESYQINDTKSKVKCEELMKIIMKQNTDMEKLKNDVAIQEAVVNRNETLQKEILIMKVATQQKEVELQNYKELLGKYKLLYSILIKGLHREANIAFDFITSSEPTLKSFVLEDNLTILLLLIQRLALRIVHHLLFVVKTFCITIKKFL